MTISTVGLGTLQWGDPAYGFPERFNEAAVRDCFQAAVDSGITFFDTAEVYGYQGTKVGFSSEHLLGRCAQTHYDADGAPLVLGSKFFTIPWTNLLVGGGVRLGRQSMIDALEATVARVRPQARARHASSINWQSHDAV